MIIFKDVNIVKLAIIMEEGNEQGLMIVNIETHKTNSRHVWIIISIHHHQTYSDIVFHECMYSYAYWVQV